MLLKYAYYKWKQKSSLTELSSIGRGGSKTASQHTSTTARRLMQQNATPVNHVLYQKFYRIKEGKLVDPVNNKAPKIEDDEDLILYQAADANIGFNVFRYTKSGIQHIKWFEERDEAIEFAFLQCMGEEHKLAQEQQSEFKKLEEKK